MLLHNLLLVYRNFRRYKSTFLINVAGLSGGLTCALFIYLWASDELAVDKFHEKDDQLFQVMTKTRKPNGDIDVGESTPFPLAKALAEELPEVEYAVPSRSWTNKQGLLSVGHKSIRATEQYVGQDYFHVFSYPLILGTKDAVLKEKSSVLISEQLAINLFNGASDAIGKRVEWNKEELSGSYFISGVFTCPDNSTAKFDLLFPFELYHEKRPQANEWSNGGTNTYVVLKRGTNVSQFNDKIETFLQSKNQVKEWSIFITSYSDKYLYGKYENGKQSGGRIAYVKLFSIVAIFILAIACINFMNLSTSKASRRIREIGIKKAIGAGRMQLIFQYLSESILVATLSLAISVLMVVIFLPQFNDIAGKQLRLSFTPHVVVTLIAITLITGLVSGSYPALYLSGFKPATVLKGLLNTSIGEVWARKGLVIFQFSISVILIVGVIVVYNQVNLLQSKDLGYTKDNVIVFRKEGKLNGDIEAFLHDVKSLPGVINASHMWGDMTRAGNITSDLTWEGKSTDDVIDFGEMHVNYDLIETLGMEMKAGRSFSRDYKTDNTKIIFNEAAIEAMGIKEPIGKTVKLWGEETQIIGVVRNFHFESLYETLKPCFLHITPYANYVVVKVGAGMESKTINQLESIYRSHNPGLAFDFNFLDERYQTQYEAENRIAALSRYFAGIAILISCLGLFGLASFTAERRIKEIGIRKILGATELGIMYLLSSEFMTLVMVGVIVALPVSYFAAKDWLSDFAYRITLEWWFFLGAALVSLIIAWLTVALQTLKAARTNPIGNLRTE